jgi:hypothetical protein
LSARFWLTNASDRSSRVGAGGSVVDGASVVDVDGASVVLVVVEGASVVVVDDVEVVDGAVVVAWKGGGPTSAMALVRASSRTVVVVVVTMVVLTPRSSTAHPAATNPTRPTINARQRHLPVPKANPLRSPCLPPPP